MGGIGIWCMHFIGNRAIVLGDGAAKIQIVYSVPFTAVSFILPVVVLLAAFYAIGTSEKAGYLRIIMGGVLTGSSAAHVVGAAIIAIFASTVALGIFFRWRATWTNSWWRSEPWFTGGDIFAKELSQELYYSNARSSTTTDSEIAPSVRALRRFWPSRKQPSDKMIAISQETLAEHSPFGEITVRKEVKVDIAKLAELSTQPTLGRHASQTTVLAGGSASGTGTYVDDLYNLCYSPKIRLRPTSLQQTSTVR